MSVENTTSRRGSGTTSTTAPDPVKLTESAYLEQQASAAKAAMAREASEMKSWLLQGANPVAWAREHPWISIGAGAVAGFVAAMTLVPSREEQALRRLRRMEAALNPNKPSTEENGNSKADGKNKKGWISSFLKELLGVLAPLMANFLKGQVAAAPTDSQQENQQNPSYPST